MAECWCNDRELTDNALCPVHGTGRQDDESPPAQFGSENVDWYADRLERRDDLQGRTPPDQHDPRWLPWMMTHSPEFVAGHTIGVEAERARIAPHRDVVLEVAGYLAASTARNPTYDADQMYARELQEVALGLQGEPSDQSNATDITTPNPTPPLRGDNPDGTGK